ncbi:hypothetical protein [Stenotrophomonas maltophilia]|uniref:hypothetical protein n=1 Tax=Stenotrophomonas maltophilia TaxID=40324 RepID=UPI002E784C44|nr:hypothetical protein [Stenotrophomonas maltophilia]
MDRGIDLKEMHTDVLALQVVVSALAMRLNEDKAFITEVQSQLANIKQFALDAEQRDILSSCVQNLVYG